MTYEKRGKELLISGSKVRILAHPPAIGAGDSGRVAKRNGSGKLDKTFPSRFGVRAI